MSMMTGVVDPRASEEAKHAVLDALRARVSNRAAHGVATRLANATIEQVGDPEVFAGRLADALRSAAEGRTPA